MALTQHISDGVGNVYADRSQMQEIVDNLISNAVKYTDKGWIDIFVENDGDFVKFKIVDTGIGIAEEDQVNLGKKFYRVGPHVSDESRLYNVVRPGGTGLGLYVTFNLVRKQGGTVSVESEPGKGSTFTFSIPKYTGQKTVVERKSKDLLKEYKKKKQKAAAE